MNIELPFSNGTHWEAWEQANCSRCTKGTLTEDSWARDCDILNAIFLAQIETDNVVSADIARRMDLREDDTRFVWKCGEWERKS